MMLCLKMSEEKTIKIKNNWLRNIQEDLKTSDYPFGEAPLTDIFFEYMEKQQLVNEKIYNYLWRRNKMEEEQIETEQVEVYEQPVQKEEPKTFNMELDAKDQDKVNAMIGCLF